MWKRIKAAWALYKNIKAAQGLLESIGWWKYLVAGGGAMGLVVYISKLHVPIWSLPLIVLVAFALLMFIVACVVLIWRAKNGITVIPTVQPINLRSDLELRRDNKNDGLILFLENNTARTLKGCGITIAMLSRFYEAMHDFIRPNEFTTINLIEPQDLGPGKRSGEVYLLCQRYPAEVPRFGNAGAIPQRTVPEPGIWRADLHVFSAPENAYSEEVFFKWEQGNRPCFVSNPAVSVDTDQELLSGETPQRLARSRTH